MPQVTLQVFRLLDDRLQPGDTGSDDSPMSWDLHCRRARALHAALDPDEEVGWTVLSWGNTDDETRTHELVEIVLALGAASGAVLATPVLNWIGEVLTGVLTDTAKDTLKSVLHRLRRQQDDRQIKDFTVSVDGRQVLRIDPDAMAGSGSVEFYGPDGRRMTMSWTATEEELRQRRARTEEAGPLA